MDFALPDSYEVSRKESSHGGNMDGSGEGWSQDNLPGKSLGWPGVIVG